MKLILAILSSVTIVGCAADYEYSVPLDASPIPYKSAFYNHEEEYESISSLYLHPTENRHLTQVSITHLTYPGYDREFEQSIGGLYRISKLDFRFKNNSEVKLVTDSVLLIHTDARGNKIEPVKIRSELANCETGGSYTLFYSGELPPNIIEKVSFKLLVRDKEVAISYEIPLVERATYPFWEALMGV